MRLGEVLVHRGIISDKQLARALDAQLIFGAHLGTCLIELGYLDEDQLGRVLADVFKVGYAGRDRLLDVPPQVIGTLPTAVADKHKAIPFDLNDRLLRVAMVNPKHLPSLDEIAFVSGLRIEAWVAPEVRVVQALERYYDVPRRLRYIVLANRLDETRSGSRGEPAEAEPRKAAQLAAAAQGGSSFAALERLEPRPAPGEEDEEPWGAGDGRAARSSPGALARPEERLGEVAEELCRADDGARIAKVALNHAARGMERCILFAVDGGAAILLETRGLGIDPARARRLRFPITAESLFGLVCGEPFYRGSVPDEPRHRAFFETLGLEIPREILIMPAYRGDRISALFYGDAGAKGSIQGETVQYVRLMRMLALAMDLVAVKQQLRAI